MLENMHAQVRGRAQCNGTQHDNTFIFKGDQEEDKWTATTLHEEATDMGRWVVEGQLDTQHSQA